MFSRLKGKRLTAQHQEARWAHFEAGWCRNQSGYILTKWQELLEIEDIHFRSPHYRQTYNQAFKNQLRCIQRDPPFNLEASLSALAVCVCVLFSLLHNAQYTQKVLSGNYTTTEAAQNSPLTPKQKVDPEPFIQKERGSL